MHRKTKFMIYIYTFIMLKYNNTTIVTEQTVI